jgi:hypothetical protein
LDLLVQAKQRLHLKVLAFPLLGRRMIEEKLRNYNSKQIVRLRSGKEVKDFLAQQVQDADDKRDSSIAPVAKEKSLVPTVR